MSAIAFVNSNVSLEAALDIEESDLYWPEALFVQAMYEEIYRINLFGRYEVNLEAGAPVQLAAWIDLPFLEAIEMFKARTDIMSKKSYDVLSDALKQKSWTIAGDHTQYTMEQAKRSIETAIAEGWTKNEWVDYAFDNGIPNLGEHHLEVVFDTNVLGSYQHGRWKQQQGSARFRPILVYKTIGDTRVRESHAAMNGFTAHRDHPSWATWYPPNGFLCRCRVEAKRATDEGIGEIFPIDETVGVEPDEGWATNPGEWLKDPQKSQR